MGRWARRNTGLRGYVRSIYRDARGIRDGTHIPVLNLHSIAFTVEMMNRRRRSDGTLEPLEGSWLWPIYRPFHAIRARWIDLQGRRELTVQRADELQGQMYEAACALLGESRSHRRPHPPGVFDKGRIRPDHPNAASVAELIIKQTLELHNRRE